MTDRNEDGQKEEEEEREEEESQQAADGAGQDEDGRHPATHGHL